MNNLRINNYVVDTPLTDIIYDIQRILTNGKLRDVEPKVDEIKLTCPNDDHEGGHEKNPDCHINLDPSKGVPFGFFHCFACGAKGPFTKFVAHCFSSSEDYAKNWLIKRYGKQVANFVDIDEPINLSISQDKKVLSDSILDSYQHYCPYLAKRKLSRDICNLFNVRYDPKYRQVVFPVYDPKGRFVMTARRSIDTKTFYMDKGAEKEVYCLDYVIKNKITTCLITEGPFDCLTGWEYGFPSIATLGAISDYQVDQINKSGIKVLYLCMDNDEAGKKFAKLLQNKLDKRIITNYVQFPKGKKDINDLSKEELTESIKNSI